MNTPLQNITVYAFADDAPHIVSAECDLAALEQAPVPCYALVEMPSNPADKRYMAMAAADGTFEIPGGYWSDDPATALAALKQHRADIQDHQAKHRGTVA